MQDLPRATVPDPSASAPLFWRRPGLSPRPAPALDEAAPLSPDPRLVDQIGAARCLQLGIVPLQRLAGAVVVATSRPAVWDQTAPELQGVLGPVRPLAVDEAAVTGAVTRLRGAALRHRAETRVPAQYSVRGRPALPHLPLLVVPVLLAVLAAPHLLFALVLGWLVLTLAATSLLRGLALFLALSDRLGPPAPAAPLRLPVVSVLVPLYGEPDIAPRLVRRLGRLNYPRALLDVILVLEEKDSETRAALSRCTLPGWMRLVTVPDGAVTTKPRAMNYALDHCRGSIIGVYDAEDAPDPDQIRLVVQRFAAAGPDLACLQGSLDYYNPRTNLIARLFTAEYAAWFRVVMPALQRLGWPMPLGGTSLFVRRNALEAAGAWDAHNVTEDADLGVRLARLGLRTEMLPSTTHEEANCRLRPWIRQRSRWIKGHMLTWAVHMRDPCALWRDLGGWGFAGYQIVFLGAQSQVLLAPLMWSFWVLPLGVWHPVRDMLPGWAIWGLAGLFLTGEALIIACAAVGLARTRHRRLWPWVPLLHLYHPLGAVAGWLALREAFANPFYWAKTSHGHFDQLADMPDARTAAVALPVPARSQPPDAATLRLARTLARTDTLAPLPGPQRVASVPASIFRRVSNAREIWVRKAS